MTCLYNLDSNHMLNGIFFLLEGGGVGWGFRTDLICVNKSLNMHAKFYSRLET